MYMYIYIYTYIHTHIHTYVHMYIHTHVLYTYACTHVYFGVYIHRSRLYIGLGLSIEYPFWFFASLQMQPIMHCFQISATHVHLCTLFKL